MGQYDFFQIPSTGVDSSTLGTPTQTRDVSMKISTFGAMNVGARDDNDYTKLTNAFESKDVSSDWSAIVPSAHAQDAEHKDNPLVWGTTTHRVRNDQFFRMGMANNSNADTVDQPSFDVSDRKGSDASTTVYLPREGWRSFGGKNDFAIAYQGSKLRGDIEAS